MTKQNAKTMKSKRQVESMAFADISAYLKEEGAIVYGEHEVWVVTPDSLGCKETRRMNRELGLHKVNKKSNQQNIKKYKQNETT